MWPARKLLLSRVVYVHSPASLSYHNLELTNSKSLG